MQMLYVIALVLLVIGGLNWGLVAVGEVDLVAAIFGMDFGETNAGSRFVYALVGISAIVLAALGFRHSRRV